MQTHTLTHRQAFQKFPVNDIQLHHLESCKDPDTLTHKNCIKSSWLETVSACTPVAEGGVATLSISMVNMFGCYVIMVYCMRACTWSGPDCCSYDWLCMRVSLCVRINSMEVSFNFTFALQEKENYFCRPGFRVWHCVCAGLCRALFLCARTNKLCYWIIRLLFK